jgi:hypothetical protein
MAPPCYSEDGRRLLRGSEGAAPCGILCCSLRLPSVHPMVADIAPCGILRCSLRPPVLLPVATVVAPTATGIASYGGRRCSLWLLVLLPMAVGIAPYGFLRCSLRPPVLLPTAVGIAAGVSCWCYKSRAGRRCYDWWLPVLHGAGWRRDNVISPVLLERWWPVLQGAGALLPTTIDDAREAALLPSVGAKVVTVVLSDPRRQRCCEASRRSKICLGHHAQSVNREEEIWFRVAFLAWSV